MRRVYDRPERVRRKAAAADANVTRALHPCREPGKGQHNRSSLARMYLPRRVAWMYDLHIDAGDACDAGDAGDAHHFQKLRRMMFSTRTSSVRASASLSSGSPGIALYEEDWPGSASEC